MSPMNPTMQNSELKAVNPAAMRKGVLPPSQRVLRTNQELSQMRHRPLTAGQAVAQVKEHLSEARSEMLRSGRPIIAG
ncbi:MAG: hypothetical protein B7Z37_27940 [Verrucomicrobia bacterium 12-59-8]|nr:MAG: hypothetical protein B7Z37_27940 [Verrucomicrobia bacterium 12-59-8]